SSVRNVADSRLSFAATIVWLNAMDMTQPVNQIRQARVGARLQDGSMPDDEVLLGPRVLLRKPRLEDAESIFATITSDPKVTEFLSWTPHPDVAETRRVITELFNV